MEKTKKADNVAVDSEEEVFFNTKRNCPESTSTPAPLPARTRKRKRKTTSSSAKMPNNSNKKNPLGENEEAEMYSDDSDCSNAKSRRTSEEGESLKTFMSRMTREMAVMNTNFLGMNDHIRTTVAEAVEPFSTKLDANNRRIDRIEHKQRTELESMKIKIDRETYKTTNGRRRTKNRCEKKKFFHMVTGREENERLVLQIEESAVINLRSTTEGSHPPGTRGIDQENQEKS